MDDAEFVILRNRLLLGLLIIIVFAIPLSIIAYNKLFYKDTKIVKKIKNQENIILFITGDNNSFNKEISNYLKTNNIDFKIVNPNKNKEYNDILSILKIASDDISLPCIMYIENGVLSIALNEIKDKESLKSFLEYNNLLEYEYE